MAWAFTLVAMTWGAYCATEVIKSVAPHLTARQRWSAVYWAVASVGAFWFAWTVGA